MKSSHLILHEKLFKSDVMRVCHKEVFVIRIVKNIFFIQNIFLSPIGGGGGGGGQRHFFL